MGLGPQSFLLHEIYERYIPYTMVPRKTYIRNLQLASRQVAVGGCVVECGVWKGGMIAGMADVLGEEREYVLCDSFEGLPPAKPVDGLAAITWQSNKESSGYFNNCTASRADAEAAMALSKAKRLHFLQGWFDQSLPSFHPREPISILRLDGDWYESTMLCLKYLFLYMAKNGIVVIDDYYTWDGCCRAVHDFLSAEKLPIRIMQWDNDVCFFVVS
jgi:O-methyltransferase